MTFAANLSAAIAALDRQLADRYGETAATRDAPEPAPINLAAVHADGSHDVDSLGLSWRRVAITPEMTEAVEAYLAAKPEHERAELAALMEAA